MNREDARQWIHIGVLAFAFNLRYLSAPWAFLLAITAFIHNVFLLPKYAPHLFRDREHISQGIALYPLMIALLILFFPQNLNLACAGWAILACGDGFSNLIGKRIPLSTLPWHREKSLGGMMAFLITASVGAFLFLAWTGPVPSYKHLAMVAICSASLCAVFETIPLPWDDNLVVTLMAAVFISLFWGVDLHPESNPLSAAWLGLCLLVNAAAGGTAFVLRFVSSSGLVGGILIGTFILAMGGWGIYFLLWIFFILATIATLIGYYDKARIGGAQEDEGRRGAKHAIANCILALIAVILYGTTDGADSLWVLFYTGALATALGDTLSSELGQVFGRNPFMPTTFRRVSPGTVGAISIEGTLFGMLGVILFSVFAYWFEIIVGNMVPAVIVGGWLGFYAESYISSYWMDEGIEVNNEWMNLLNTFIGGILAVVIAFLTQAI